MWNPAKSLVWRLAILILGGAGLVLAAVLVSSTIAQQRQLVKQQQQQGDSLTLAAVNRIDALLGRVVSTANSVSVCMKKGLPTAQDAEKLLADLMRKSPEINGISIAAVHGTTDWAPGVISAYRDNGTVRTRVAPRSQSHQIEDWYYLPTHLGRNVWVEPYFDHTSGRSSVTYSVPVKGADGTIIGVVTCELSLEGIREMLDSLDLGEAGIATLVSAQGVYISHPIRAFEMRETVYSVAESMGDVGKPLESLIALSRKMLSGEAGMSLYRRSPKDTPSYVYYRTVPATGWACSVTIPEQQILAPLRRQNTLNLLIGLSGMVLLLGAALAVAFSLTRPLHELAGAAGRLATGDFDAPLPKVRHNDEIGRLTSSFARMREELHSYIEELTTTTAAKEKIASELAIAHQIQLGIVPKLFPPFPERGDLDLFATLEPAREVGGDLYDFTLLDEDHLYVAIGDVSGKGVPASLLMAVGKTLLKSTIQAVRDPARAMTMVNDELSADNESCMFITAFCGILNLRTGQLTFANAGHNPPLIISQSGDTRFLTRRPGPALGAMCSVRYQNMDVELENGELLLLYTDGVTEAMNAKGELFAEDRMAAVAAANPKANTQQLIRTIVGAVTAHADGFEQSDDITMLAVRSTTCRAIEAPQPPSRQADSTIELNNKREELNNLVEWLEGEGEKLGIPAHTVMALNLALEEWFINIVSYAFVDHNLHRIPIRMWRDDNTILIQIEDEGQPFDPCAQLAPDTDAPLEHRRIGGLGIHFIRKTMDLMHYRRERNRNILTLAKKF